MKKRKSLIAIIALPVLLLVSTPGAHALSCAGPGVAGDVAKEDSPRTGYLAEEKQWAFRQAVEVQFDATWRSIAERLRRAVGISTSEKLHQVAYQDLVNVVQEADLAELRKKLVSYFKEVFGEENIEDEELAINGFPGRKNLIVKIKPSAACQRWPKIMVNAHMDTIRGLTAENAEIAERIEDRVLTPSPRPQTPPETRV